MSPITLNISCNLEPEQLFALMEKFASLPSPTFFGTDVVAAPVFPPVPASAGAAYQAIAAENLRVLADGHIPEQGWARADLPKAIAQLPVDTRKVVLRAIENGGHVTRGEVYQLLGRLESQSLKGFTRPVNRVMEALKAIGEIDPAAEPLLVPIYDQTTKTYQQAQGFSVPVQVVHRMKVAKH